MMPQQIAKILKTHGLSGSLKLFVLTAHPEHYLYPEAEVLVAGKSLKIKTIKRQKGNYYVTFEGYAEINLALPLVGLEITSNQPQPRLQRDHFFVKDLVNSDVYFDQQAFGKVIAVTTLPQGDYLRIEHNLRAQLVPFRTQFLDFDLATRTINLTALGRSLFNAD